MINRCILLKKLGTITLFICFTMFCWSSYAAEWSALCPADPALPFQYTAVQANIGYNCKVQMVIGGNNGMLVYYNPNQSKWINIPIPLAQAGNTVTALHCTWGNTDNGSNNNLPNIIAGFSDGSLYQFLPNDNAKGIWSSLVGGRVQTLNQVLAISPYVKYKKDGSFSSCAIITGVIPNSAKSPLDYKNMNCWRVGLDSMYSIVTGTNTLINYNSPDTQGEEYMTVILHDSGLRPLYGRDIVLLPSVRCEGCITSETLSTGIISAASLGYNQVKFTPTLFVSTNFMNDYGALYELIKIGWDSQFKKYKYYTGDPSNYPLFSMPSPLKPGDIAGDIVVANNCIMLWSIGQGTFLTKPSVLWNDDNHTAFNGLNVNWWNHEMSGQPLAFIAGLVNGKLVCTWLGKPTVLDAPPHFPANGENYLSQTFACAGLSCALEIFNDGTNCYVYIMKNIPLAALKANPIKLDISASGTDTTGQMNAGKDN